MLTILAGIPIIYIGAYFALLPAIPAWSNFDRGFRIFEKSWINIFLTTGVIAIILGSALKLFTTASDPTALTIAAVSGLLLIAAYTDSVVGKVPLELSHTTVLTAFVLGIGTLIINSFNVENYQRFYNTIPLVFSNQEWIWIGASVAVFLIFFLVWFRSHGLVAGLFSILISMVALWVAASATLNLIAKAFMTTGENEFWRNALVYGLPSMLIIALFAVAFDLGAGKYLGGADAQSMYAVAWGFGAIVGGVVIGLGVIAAAIVQLLLHLFAKPLGLRTRNKEIPNSQITKLWFKVTRRPELAEKETRIAHSLPFLPTLNVGVIFATVFAVGFPGLLG